MNAPRPLTASLSALSAAAAFLFAGVASADCPAGGCPTGFDCQVVGMTGCAVPDCAPNTICPPPPSCTTTEITSCVPKQCTTDADCATDMVCYESVNVATCASAPCPAGAECFAPPCTEPTTTASHTCVPKYSLPCTVSADCGTGFTCVADTTCTAIAGTGTATPGTSGSGTAGSAGVDGGAPSGGAASTGGASGVGGIPIDPPLPMPDPTCTTLPTNHCEPMQIGCTSDANCPATWTCVQSYSGGGTACSGGVPTDPTQPTPPDTCTTIPSTPGPSYCMPPYYTLGFGTASNGEAGLPRDAQTGGTAGGVANTGGATGAGATSGTGSTYGGAGGPSGTPPTTGTGGSTGAGSSSNDSGGCQVAFGSTRSGSFALLGLAGILGLARRRRARA